MKLPFTDNRPWGSFRQFTENEQTTVKLLYINPHQQFSLQSHEHRKEFWHVLAGNPILTIGDKQIQTNPGDEFMIEIGTKHRIHATETQAVVLEIAYGNFDEEEDIIRYEDDYGRA